jgi:two-component sensor histidine kinase
VTEQERLSVVNKYDLLDTGPEVAFDRITSMAARLLEVPVAIISVVDQDRIWFKSRHGVGLEQVDREPGLCASCMLQRDAWLIEDARNDPLARNNPLVAGEFGAQSYFGVPLLSHDGFGLGALGVLDFAPRTMTARQVADLTDLAAVIMDEFELRRTARTALSAYQAELARRELREDHIHGLNRELAHRAKNLLAVVQAIARQTKSGSSSTSDYISRLSARIQGLAHTHDLISDTDWRGATLRDLVARQLGPFLDKSERLEVAGPKILLTPTAAQNIGLALHELASNAREFGALSIADGRVLIDWRLDAVRHMLSLSWREEQCPTPDRSDAGFGRLVLEEIVPAALDGTARLSFEPECVCWELEVSDKHVLPAR